MAQGWVDRCIYLPVSAGTASFVTASAVQGYLTPLKANAVDGTSYHYAAQLLNATTNLPSEWEVGTGVYTAASQTLTRATIEFNSDNTTTAHNFSSPPSIMLTPLAQDFGSFTSTSAGFTPASGGGTANFLRADGTFTTPSAGAGGATSSIQFNNAGALGGFGQWNGSSTLSLQNTTTPQTLAVYNIFTSSSNYERAVVDWNTTTNVLTVGAQATGSGSLRGMNLLGGGGKLTVAANLVYNNGAANVFSVAVNAIAQVYGGYSIGWGTADSNGAADTGISRVVAGVTAFGNSNPADRTGWMQWGGQARVSAQFNATSTTTLANVPGLSITLATARTYTFEGTLFTQSNTAGGVQVTLGGSCTGTTVIYEGTTIDGTTIVTRTRVSNLGSTIGLATAVSTARIDIVGTITVVNGGTLTVQFAQAASSGTASSVLIGSKFLAYDMP